MQLNSTSRMLASISMTISHASPYIRQFSHYETFLFEFLAMLLRINPYALSPKKQLTVDEVLDAGAFDALVERLIQRELNELRYRSVPDWFRFLGKIVNLNAVSQPDIDRVSELKATRDAHLHNRGIANETYVRKAGGLARAQAGQPVLVSRPVRVRRRGFPEGFHRQEGSVCP